MADAMAIVEDCPPTRLMHVILDNGHLDGHGAWHDLVGRGRIEIKQRGSGVFEQAKKRRIANQAMLDHLGVARG